MHFVASNYALGQIFFSSQYLFEVFLIGSHKREKKIFFSCCFCLCLCLYIRFRFQHHKGSNNNTIGKQINKDWRTNCSWIVFAFVHIFVILFGFGWDWEIIRLLVMTNFNIRPTYLWTFFIEARSWNSGGASRLFGKIFWWGYLQLLENHAGGRCLSLSFIGFLWPSFLKKIWGYMGFGIFSNKVF